MLINNEYYYRSIMEYCTGSHLNKHLLSHPSDKLTEIESSYYFYHQIIKSIQSPHEQAIIHRDIKPQNILLYYDKNGASLPITKLCILD